jgi:uncharacterized protein (TIGR04222 family)
VIPLADSILDLSGPDFLALYVQLIVAGLFVAGLAGLVAKLPIDGPDQRIHALVPVEVAYLAGGARNAIDAALASLVHEGRIGSGVGSRTLVATGDAPSGKRTHLERAVHAAVSPRETSIDQIHSSARAAGEAIAQRVEALGLALPQARRDGAGLLMAAPFGVLAAIGIAKIAVAISRGRFNLMFLFLLVAVVVGLVAAAWRFRPHCTFRGHLALRQLQNENAALGTTSRSAFGTSDLSGGDMALAFALFGPAVLRGPGLSSLALALAPPPSAYGGSSWSSWGSCSSSCSSWSSCSTCSSSSCGSGCGGGGGGGGCGGCGS